MSELTLTEEQIALMGQDIHGSQSFGPLTIYYDIDLSVPQITFDLKVHGHSIGGGTINPSNPSVTIKGSKGFIEVDVNLTANFDAKQVDYRVSVKAFGSTIVETGGILFTW